MHNWSIAAGETTLRNFTVSFLNVCKFDLSFFIIFSLILIKHACNNTSMFHSITRHLTEHHNNTTDKYFCTFKYSRFMKSHVYISKCSAPSGIIFMFFINNKCVMRIPVVTNNLKWVMARAKQHQKHVPCCVPDYWDQEALLISTYFTSIFQVHYELVNNISKWTARDKRHIHLPVRIQHLNITKRLISSTC